LSFTYPLQSIVSFTIHNTRRLPETRNIFVAFVLFIAGCTGLGGEPEVVATLPPPPTFAPVVIAYPEAAPNMDEGAELFAEFCTECHGENGQGNGPLVLAGQIPTEIRDFTDPNTTLDTTPQDWFDIITNGRLEALMPPWRNSLDESQRWAVTMYVYMMSVTSEQVDLGREVWAANCAECHGSDGRGPQGNLQEMVALSDGAILAAINQGVGGIMPAFAETLSADERQAALAYLRTLALTGTESLGTVQMVESTQEAAPAPTQVAAAETPGTITGTVTNATLNEPVGTDAQAVLHIINARLEEELITIDVDANGTFTFTGVPIRIDRRYMVTVQYGDGFFVSDIISGNPENTEIDLPVTVYELTNDESAISIDELLLQINPIEGGLQIIQIMRFSNNSDRLFLTEQEIDNFRQASVTVTLPEMAQIFDFDNPDRYRVDGLTVTDTQPIFPNESHFVHVMYGLPYDGDGALAFPINYTMDANVQILAAQGLTLSGDDLISAGSQDFGEMVFNVYQGEVSRSAGESVVYELRGGAVAATTGGDGSLPTTTVIAVLLVTGGGVMIVSALLLYWRGQGKATSDDLVREIAELDQRYHDGEIEEAAYTRQRQTLKDRLSKLMDGN
jgi:mono/diheme cytochrome c family protein